MHGTLTTDFDMMSAVAAKVDTSNEEIRAMLSGFIGQMTAIPPAVWGGAAALRFQDVVDRWNTESMKLHAALGRIAETVRNNADTLREAGQLHGQQIAAVAHTL